MVTVKISSKNQITLPKSILKLLDLVSGDRLIVKHDLGEIRLRPLSTSIVEDVAGGIYVSESKKNVSFEKALAATKKSVSRKLAQK